MKVYLAATNNYRNIFGQNSIRPEDVYLLESFYSLDEWQKAMIPRSKGFMLDSGAFSFMNSQNGDSIDWLSYADRYADFIKEHGVQQYFELDIDTLKDIHYVEMLRKRIEARCGVQSIPVWHRGRGKDYFIGMCHDYPYVALGGIVTKEIDRARYEQLFPWFIATAHRARCKIHGLGYTNLDGLKRFCFDSVDSTSWKSGSIYGHLAMFRKGTITYYNPEDGVRKRVKDGYGAAAHNFAEWVKFQKYADNNL